MLCENDEIAGHMRSASLDLYFNVDALRYPWPSNAVLFMKLITHIWPSKSSKPMINACLFILLRLSASLHIMKVPPFGEIVKGGRDERDRI